MGGMSISFATEVAGGGDAGRGRRTGGDWRGDREALADVSHCVVAVGGQKGGTGKSTVGG
jgi:hypothetical protein